MTSTWFVEVEYIDDDEVFLAKCADLPGYFAWDADRKQALHKYCVCLGDYLEKLAVVPHPNIPGEDKKGYCVEIGAANGYALQAWEKGKGDLVVGFPKEDGLDGVPAAIADRLAFVVSGLTFEEMVHEAGFEI